ncbi:MAG: glycerol-3-phosphate 1-O-acyltransferase PlsY [Cardiobacteriaceae bacterium]|nr:glycerol-3-phosphate 1-O-acyltransferase PlsY [Cardiobacteriaceae bacterium]
MNTVFCLLAALFGYLAGSLSSAIIVCRIFGLPDPRTQGSNNPGTTNVLRLGGKKAAAITLLGDVLKGVIPALILKLIFPEETMLWLLAGFFAFIGHIYPVFFAFKGGKGVATAAGVLLVWEPLVGLLCIGAWVLIFAITRLSSLAALAAAFVAPIATFALNRSGKELPILVLFIVAMLVFRHRGNIQRLLSGQEQAFKSNKTSSADKT